MKLNQFNWHSIAGAACLVAGFVGAANAYADEDRYTFNGFGNQDYRRSTANSYMGADSTGTWDNNFLGLVMSAKINEKARAWAQLQASTTSVANPTGSARFTWMFVDYQFSDSVSAHVGRIKFPFGLYNETINTQALRPTIAEPVVYALAADMTYNAYHGVGVDWHKDLGGPGSIMTQVFAGNIYVEPEHKETTLRDVGLIGGRITYNTPVEGMRLMISANRTTVEAQNTGAPTGEKAHEDRAMLSFDYVAHDWDIKAEYNYHTTPALATAQDALTVPPVLPGDVIANKQRAYYIQAAYDMGKFTPYARYDYVNTDTTLKNNPANYQKIYVIGVGYKLADNLNLRAEQHFNHGYALGAPEMGVVMPAYVPHLNWNTTMVSMNFMF